MLATAALATSMPMLTALRITPASSNIGIFYFSQKEYRKALEYDFKALKFYEGLDNKSNVAINLGNIGDTYLHLDEYAWSLDYSFQSLRLFEELGDKYGAAIGLGNIGEAYLAVAKNGSDSPDSLIPNGKAANLRKAIEYLNKSIVASRAIAQLDNIIEFSQYLSEAYALSGNDKDALESYRQYAAMNDSVYNATNSLRIKQSDHLMRWS